MQVRATTSHVCMDFKYQVSHAGSPSVDTVVDQSFPASVAGVVIQEMDTGQDCNLASSDRSSPPCLTTCKVQCTHGLSRIRALEKSAYKNRWCVIGSVMWKHVVIHKTGSGASLITTQPKKDRATATVDMHKNWMKIGRCRFWDMQAEGERDRRTNRHARHNISHLSRTEVKLGCVFFIASDCSRAICPGSFNTSERSTLRSLIPDGIARTARIFVGGYSCTAWEFTTLVYLYFWLQYDKWKILTKSMYLQCILSG